MGEGGRLAAAGGVVSRAYHLAVQRVADIGALMERTEAAIKAHGLIIGCMGERGLLDHDEENGNLVQSDLPRTPRKET